MTQIKLFISYRRSDAAHAAQRVRASLQAKFGADAVFIDREIPPGVMWESYLTEKLQSASDVIVLVGDEFFVELRRRAAHEKDDPDWLKREIQMAIDLKKRIYPVLIGSRDMPAASKLPAEIRGLASLNAVFAREPAFDIVIGKLASSIAEEHRWVAPLAAVSPAVNPAAVWAVYAATASLVAAGALWLTGLTGLLIEWLAGTKPGVVDVSTFWTGALFVLTTALWALGPYLMFRAVAEIRAHAQLPIHNLTSLLTIVNLVLALLAGGTFLLLSTRAHWALRLLWVMPESPSPVGYALQGVALLIIGFATFAVAMAEPAVRRWKEEWRARGMAALNGFAVIVMLAALWFAASLKQSLPGLADLESVPMVGYFMLAPALSGLLIAWDLAQSSLGLSGRAWRNRALLGLVIALYLACTLGYFARGPLRLFIVPG